MIDESKLARGRKFHDAWAFFLYVIAVSAVYGVAIVQGQGLVLGSLETDCRLIAAVLGYVACIVLVMVLLFRFCPKFTLHFSFLGGNILNLYLALHFRETYLITYAAIWGVTSLLFYFLCGYHYIAFTSVILRDSARVLIAYLPHFVLIELAAASLIVASCAALLICEAFVHNMRYAVLQEVLLVLCLFWTMSNMQYVLTVFASSIAGIHVLSRGRPRSTLSRAFRNTFFALGSICLGGLIIAVIRTLQCIVRRPREGKRSLLVSMVQVLCMMLLYLVEDIALMINDWAYPYLAIHGVSFKSSIASSFEIATRGDGAAIIASSCINVAIFFVVATCMVGSGALVKAMSDTLPKVDFLCFENLSYFSIATMALLAFSLIYNFAELFSALSKSIMFLYAENSRAVSEVLPDSGRALQQKVESTSQHQTRILSGRVGGRCVYEA